MRRNTPTSAAARRPSRLRAVLAAVAAACIGMVAASALAATTSPPTKPGSLVARLVTRTTVDLAWAPSRGSAAITGYRVYVNGSLRASVTSTSYRITYLHCGHQYGLAVRAYDASGARSLVQARVVNTSPCQGAGQAPTPSTTCTRTIGTGAGLSSVLAGAGARSVICLSGGDYGEVKIENVHRSGPITIRPLAGASASMELQVVDSSGLRFVGLTLRGALVSSSGNTWFVHDTFTATTQVQTQLRDANIVFNGNRLDNIDVGSSDNEGRITIRGYGKGKPVGVMIENNHFGGGCSDGVQIIGDADGVRIGPGNEFTGIKQTGCAPHSDPIQFYGAVNTVVTGNYFHDNGDGTGGLESFNGDSPATVTNNVFVCTCVYPLSIAALGGQGWVVAHNTFVRGTVRFAPSNGNPSGNVVRDNVWVGGGGLSATAGWGTSDHNLNSGEPGVGNINGTPKFVGGSNPSTYAGFRLAPGSRGKHAASDGSDMGILGRR